MGFKRRFLSHFLFAVEKKVQTFSYRKTLPTLSVICYCKCYLPKGGGFGWFTTRGAMEAAH